MPCFLEFVGFDESPGKDWVGLRVAFSLVWAHMREEIDDWVESMGL